MGSTQGLWPRTAHKLQLNMKLAPSTSEVDQLTIIIGLRLHILLVNERAAVFTASAPCTTCCFKPSFSIPAQYIRKEHIMQTISVGDLILLLSNHTEFLVPQIAHHTAANPTACIWEPWGRMFLIQVQYWSILPGLSQLPENAPTNSRYTWPFGTQRKCDWYFHYLCRMKNV